MDSMLMIWMSVSFLMISLIFFLMTNRLVVSLRIRAISISLGEPPLTNEPKRMISITCSLSNFFNSFW